VEAAGDLAQFVQDADQPVCNVAELLGQLAGVGAVAGVPAGS
jgi:hypothetical protein